MLVIPCSRPRVLLQIDDGAFTEQSVKQVLQSAKENLKWSLLK